MKCDVCGGEMKIGQAINSAREDDHWFGMHVSVDADTIALMTVHKCVDCGRSLTEREVYRKEEQKRMYPDNGLKTVTGEYQSSLVEVVKANFPKIR